MPTPKCQMKDEIDLKIEEHHIAIDIGIAIEIEKKWDVNMQTGTVE